MAARATETDLAVPGGVCAVGLRKSYGTAAARVDVLADIDLSLEAGESLAVTGPSGSGKSTLLHLLGTLEMPDGGRLTIDGVDPFALDEKGLSRFRNRNLGFVFQDHHLLPQYPALDNVLLPTLAGHGNRVGTAAAEQARSLERARTLLHGVGLQDRLHHLPAQLSGGERQRVAVARALINDPDLLLCDEPTGNLDAGTAADVTDLLFSLHREQGNILVVVTHSAALAGRCQRRCELRDGRCSAA